MICDFFNEIPRDLVPAVTKRYFASAVTLKNESFIVTERNHGGVTIISSLRNGAVPVQRNFQLANFNKKQQRGENMRELRRGTWNTTDVNELAHLKRLHRKCVQVTRKVRQLPAGSKLAKKKLCVLFRNSQISQFWPTWPFSLKEKPFPGWNLPSDSAKNVQVVSRTAKEAQTRASRDSRLKMLFSETIIQTGSQRGWVPRANNFGYD